MKSIHEYSDFRSYLKDHFERSKSANPRWSLRAWARKLGLSSPSGLAMILNGKRNLGRELAERMADYLKLEGAERVYFLSLARLTPNPANAPLISLLQKQTAQAGRRGAAAGPGLSRELSEDERLAFRWFFYVIREMSLLEGFKPDPAWIVARVKAAIDPAEAEAAVASLLRQGFLVREPQGKVRPAEGRIAHSGADTAPLAASFHEEMLELARASLQKDAPHERGFFSSTVTISRKRLPEAKEAIRKFRMEFERQFEAAGGDATCQLNTQLFLLAGLGEG